MEQVGIYFERAIMVFDHKVSQRPSSNIVKAYPNRVGTISVIDQRIVWDAIKELWGEGIVGPNFGGSFLFNSKMEPDFLSTSI